MFELLRPVLSLVMGLILALLALVQSFRSFPAPGIWQQVANAAPQFSAVIWFMLCAVMTLVGLTMLIVGIGNCRQFYRQFNRTPGIPGMPAHRDPHYDDRHEWA